MKHFITLLLGMLLALPFSGYAQQSIRGDVNGSGIVDVEDVNAVINIMLNYIGPTAAADVDGSGIVDVEDLNVVINIILGMDDGGSHDQCDWVDLGLPSGTLWANRNIGASSPEDYGDYFAWGETSPKAVYNWDTYKWYEEYYDAEGDFHWGLTKYCTQVVGGLDDFVDNKTELDLDDDAAAVNWGGGARMPSIDQIQELVDNCTWQWTQRNDVNGKLVTGPNGSTIFLPAAGGRWDDSRSNSLFDRYFDGSYWSRALYVVVHGDVGNLHFNYLDHAYLDSGYPRCYGFPVRAVRVP
ncbi:MAG: dockerin type I repeat-containing protein [Muribaculaceae bacterium]|nr:dockerin type I repeat-containing protein [Muribaculaceae bacterium]